MRGIFLGLALLVPLAVGAMAQTKPSPIEVADAWARATSPAATTGAVYLTIVDHGAPDRVIGFATPIADMAQLHETTMQGNVMQMRPVDGLAVTDKSPVTLAPGGYHVMLMGLKEPLRQGQTFPISITFRNAGTIQTAVVVKGIGDAGHTQSSGPGHSMDMTGSMPGTEMTRPMPGTEMTAPMPATGMTKPMPATEMTAPMPATEMTAPMPATQK